LGSFALFGIIIELITKTVKNDTENNLTIYSCDGVHSLFN
jgi:hypothetical protein